MIDLDLIAIRKRVEAATPGPWEFERISHGNPDSFSYERNDNYAFISIREDNYKKRMKAKFDAEFIAHAREDIPMLLDLVEELKKRIEDLEDQVWQFGGAKT